jgi:hypothetical protein
MRLPVGKGQCWDATYATCKKVKSVHNVVDRFSPGSGGKLIGTDWVLDSISQRPYSKTYGYEL